MQFISTKASPSFILKHGSRKLDAYGNVASYQRPAVVSFVALASPYNSDLLPTKSKTAKGRLDTEVAAAKLYREGNSYMELDPETKEPVDVTERFIIERLLSHESYGIEFVALGNDGKEIVPSEGYILADGDKGAVYCTVCAKHFVNRGAAETHALKSFEHKRKMEVIQARDRRAMAG